MLYRGMDRAQLDAAYNNSAAVPERDATVAGWAARSARVRRECGFYSGLISLRRRTFGRRPPDRDDDTATRGARRDRDQRHLRPGADPAQLPQREAGSRYGRGERNGPVRHLPVTAGELFVAYGVRELPELCRQSIENARAWTERGLPGRLLPVDGADHFTILDSLGRSDASASGDARSLVACRP